MYQAPTSSASRRILVVLALALFIVALVLVIVQSLTSKGSSVIGTYGQGYKDGFNDARTIAYDLGISEPKGLKTLSATITRINGSTLTVEALGLFVSDDVDEVGTTRSVVIDGNTQIVERSDKTQTEIQNEQDAFARKLTAFDPASGNTPPAPPDLKMETAISLSDLSVGDVIRITGAGDEDLLQAGTFTASKVSKQAKPQMQEEPPPVEDVEMDEAL